MRSELLELAARCEAAEGADRELDAEIMVALKSRTYFTARLYRIGERAAAGAGPDSDWRNAIILFQDVPYTASLDAAMTLVPKDAFWRLGHDGEGPDPSMFRADVLQTPGAGHHVSRALTPALALTAASLRALAAQGEG